MAKSVMTLGNNNDLKLKVEQLIDEAYIRGHDDGKKKSTLHCWTTKEIEACEEIKNEAYQRGSEDAWKRIVDVRSKDIECGYNRGLNDAWECGRRITNETSVVLSKIFGEVDVSAVFQLYTPQEAMQKIKDYERRQKWAEQSKRGKEHRDEIEKMLEGKTKRTCDNCSHPKYGCQECGEDLDNWKQKPLEDNYVDAIVKVRVPKWQIGEKVDLYFKDTMHTNGVCEADKK